MKRGKRYQESLKLIEKGASYEPKAAFELIEKMCEIMKRDEELAEKYYIQLSYFKKNFYKSKVKGNFQDFYVTDLIFKKNYYNGYSDYSDFIIETYLRRVYDGIDREKLLKSSKNISKMQRQLFGTDLLAFASLTTLK